MKEILDNESEIIGNWIFENGRMINDETSDRINWLIEDYLIFVTNGGDIWEVLYQDPNDKRYWELTYPNGEMHGGGPRKLTCLSNDLAIQKYDIKDD